MAIVCVSRVQGRSQDFWFGGGANFGWSLSQNLSKRENNSASSRLFQLVKYNKMYYFFWDKSSKKYKPKTKRANELHFICRGLSTPKPMPGYVPARVMVFRLEILEPQILAFTAQSLENLSNYRLEKTTIFPQRENIGGNHTAYVTMSYHRMSESWLNQSADRHFLYVCNAIFCIFYHIWGPKIMTALKWQELCFSADCGRLKA